MDFAILEPVQHGTSKQNITFYYHRLPCVHKDDYYGFTAHWHTEYEIIYVYQGPASFTLNGVLQRVESGQALFVNKKVIHAAIPPSNSVQYVCVTFGEQFLFSSTLDVLYEKYFFPLHVEYKEMPSFLEGNCNWQKEMLKVIQKLCMSGLKKPVGCELEWRILLLQLYHIAYTNDVFLTKVPSSDENNTAIQAALLTIQKNYTEPIQVSLLAKEAGFSVEHFSRVFKYVTGMSPINYIISCRIQHAEHLLTHTSLSVSEIATTSGFNDINYFSRYFKKIHNLSPTQYRKTFS